MQKITASQIRKLAENQDLICMSFYIPTARAGKETTNNPTRLRNHLADAKERLGKMGADADVIERLLKPLEDLVHDYEFWQNQEDGLCILRSENVMEMYSVPKPAPEILVIGHDFHFKHLLPQLEGHTRFHVMAISQGRARLFRCDEWSIKDITPEDMPKSTDDYAPLDEPQRGLHEGPGRPGLVNVGGNATQALHGYGLNKDRQREDLENYLHAVDRALIPVLNKEGKLLVLAGPEPSLSFFRNNTKWQNLAEEHIEGSQDKRSEKDIHKEALEIVHRHRARERDIEMKRVGEAMAANGHGLTDLKEVVRAAAYGQVDTAFVPLNAHYWGNFDRSTGAVEPVDGHRHCTHDLLDFVAVQTILNGGRVFPVQREDMPEGQLVAALLRY